jgi:hypothetical protein
MHAVGVAHDLLPDRVEHAAEDAAVDGVEGVPVDQADDSGGIEHRGLAHRGTLRVLIDLELQPQPAGDQHLRLQAEQSVGFEAFHAPEIQGVTLRERDRVAAPTAQTDASSEGVYASADSPEPVGVVPTRRPADALDGRERLR